MKALRVLHAAALLAPSSGMLAQMDWEQAAADSLGLDWRVRMFCPLNSKSRAAVLHEDQALDVSQLNSPWSKVLAWFRLRQDYHRWLLSQQDEVDAFLLRYYVHDPYQFWFIKQCRKPVFFVHHTLEVPELALPGGFRGFVRSWLERSLGRGTIARAAGVIGVTEEIVEYELARSGTPHKWRYVYPNGIMFEDCSLVDGRSEEVPELLFVANFAPWHGLDILLRSIAESDEDFVVHMVGNVPEALLGACKDSRIRLHGQLSHEQIAKLSEVCWLGLASFALFRKKMRQACPLKVREYLMLGLPVCGDYEDIFPPSFPCYSKTGSDFTRILAFAKETRVLEKVDVATMARQWIDKELLLANLYRTINETVTSEPVA